MGVPVVTIAGKAMFERLSHSILTNAGLADLSTGSPEEMVAVALKLAGDHERRKRLRTGLRETLKASPLGQTRQFATDFYAMIERAVTERGLAPAAA
jgi:predicted O-linked N-acetylglucosamine transferase (SPINDLY family)